MSTKRERNRAREVRRLKKKPALHSSGCWKPIDIVWFQEQRDAGKLPILCPHCGGILYSGRFNGKA